ncbi:MAG: BREX-1 system adenine-specific DNA-methyltransferase PglX [Candidatus Cloacimonetes bacterium]|nr:BREX-1 system adenine-specific DNA-methyltransferase PglX [Candidatus Cloacimonadota bacterium]
MKLSEHTEHIRQLIDQAFRNRLGRMGINEGQLVPIDNPPAERKRMETIREVFIAETGTVGDAYEKLVEELTFTLFNRLAALKVMEAHTLHPEIVTRRESHGGRSFAHLAWLEQNPNARNEEAEGLLPFLEDQLQKLASDIPLFSPQHPYHLLPTALELLGIINAFNQVETDTQVEAEIWKSDDVLGWLYESYNNYKKAAHKASGDKTEYNKVSIQSQVYTPRWVVQFLVDNSLGKLYMEMYPDSEIRNKYKIAHSITNGQLGITNDTDIPNSSFLIPNSKKLHEIKIIDPATGSGNFLLYAFDLFYDLYLDQIENYGADYDQADIPKLIIENNLHGVDLDDRAIQLAQLGLYIKAKRKKRSVKIEHFNIVSSDFFLPAYEEVKHLFENGAPLDAQLEKIVIDLWEDLQQAHKFGSLIRLEEKFSIKLHGLVKEEGITLFTEENLKNYEEFRTNFFTNLQKAVAQNTAKQGQTFLNTKTQDAITFLQLLTQKYDVAVANPPYTDSADFGPELKKFVEVNYKQPYKFNTNLYACFIKRCSELTADKGYVGMIHPLTFMYIKDFEDVRKFMLTKMAINIFIEFGLGGVFTSKVDVDVSAYVICNTNTANSIYFMNLQKYKGLKIKKDIFEKAYSDYLHSFDNEHNFICEQSKLKIIQGWPFIYWISDSFRNKFKNTPLKEELNIVTGLMTGNNDRFLRYKWEVESISVNYPVDKIKWVPYQKGGDFNKWYGNNWLVVNFDNSGSLLATTDNKRFYFKEGITYSATSSKGVSYRRIEANQIFDKKGSCLFPQKGTTSERMNYFLALLNSKIATYIINSLNSTVETQVGDVKRVPFIEPKANIENSISVLCSQNINIKKQLCFYRIYEHTFNQTPLLAFQDTALKDRVLNFFNFENAQLTQVLINEAIINELIFEVYELSDADREQVEAKMGKSIGQLPIANYELGIRNGSIVDLFIEEAKITDEVVLEHLRSLPLIEFEPEKIREIKEGFAALYQSNNDLEAFCIRHQVNPINVWYWFKEAQIVPAARAAEIALEFLADNIRTLLQQDEDGIIPLVGLPGEEALSQRLEQHCLQNGFTAAQYMQLDSLLGRSVNEYLEHYFFNDLGNLVNLFRHLPKTPFIWHLSSGQHQGLEVYVLIYKWNRDSLFKLKSQYISHRVQNLEYRQITLQDVNTAQAQTEKEKIRLQLHEIETFKTKIDELIAEGYDPKLDDGVGKNIAPLQKKGLLRAEVLKTTGRRPQLEKYLNADW